MTVLPFTKSFSENDLTITKTLATTIKGSPTVLPTLAQSAPSIGNQLSTLTTILIGAISFVSLALVVVLIVFAVLVAIV